MKDLCTLLMAILFGATSAFAADEKHDRAIELLSQDISQHIVHLDREIRTFSYASADSVFSHGSESAGFNNVQHSIAAIGSGSSDISSTYGPGFYLAIDPLISRPYGGDNFAVFVVKLTPKMAYFFEPRDRKFSDATVQIMDELGCGLQSPVSKRFTIGRPLKKVECSGIVLEALRRNSVGAIAYQFGSVQMKGCSGQSSIAFVVINGAIIQHDDFTLLLKNGDNGAEMKRQISAINYIARENGHSVNEFWPGEPVAAQDAAMKWSSEFLLNCQPK